jgi:exopolysaccharide biosynthesis polyprenyl glycosylphosphotransferase
MLLSILRGAYNPNLQMNTEETYRVERSLSWPHGQCGNGEGAESLERGIATEEPRSQRAPHIFGNEWAATVIFLCLDIFCWLLIYGTISFLRQGSFSPKPHGFLLLNALQLGVILQAIFVVGGYGRNTQMRSLTYTAEHILALLAALALSSVLIYVAATFDQTMKPSRGVLLLSFVAFLPPSIFYRRAFAEQIASSAAKRAFLVIGSGKVATAFYEAYQGSSNRQQLEFVDPDGQHVGQRLAGPHSPIIGGNCEQKLANLEHRYSGVIVAEKSDRLNKGLVENLVRTQFHRARVYTLESFYEAHWRHVPLHAIDPIWPLQMGFQLARNSPYQYLKRLFDLVFSILLLVIFAPLFAIIALLIWIDGKRASSSDGVPSHRQRPILFRQERVGRANQPFIAYKFRTMVMNSSAEAGDIYTRKNDPRVTPLGRWLRKLRLDELPQLYNVFRGQMSLIGPRAEWVRCAERYEKAIPFYHFRQLVKPGITGWAQVNYPYGESDEDAIEKLKYDLYYIRNYSLTLDAMIVLKTVHTMLFSRGR